MAVPSNFISACCPLPYFSVPTGPYVLYEAWGKNMGLLSPGLKTCWMPYKSISHVVTKAAITYDAPTYNVPTADNVMVNVDVSMTFSISGGESAASDFVYKIGPVNFTDLMAAKTEEAVRALVYGVTHNKVNDLREEFATTMLDNLKSKVAIYGVRMMNVKVTNVMLPRELQERLEKTTTFQTKIEEAAKVQENTVLLLENDCNKQIETIRKSNLRKLQDLSAECQRFEIEMKELEVGHSCWCCLLLMLSVCCEGYLVELPRTEQSLRNMYFLCCLNISNFALPCCHVLLLLLPVCLSVLHVCCPTGCGERAVSRGSHGKTRPG